MASRKISINPTGFRNIYWDRRMAIIFLLGFASGFPWVLIGSVMTARLKEAGLTRSAIGYFGSIFVVYAFNFAWAPLVDRFRLPVLGHLLGQRRSWLVLMQGLLVGLCMAIGFSDPSISVLWTSSLGLGIALASATQDIAIDAYRIEIIEENEVHKIPAGAAMATSGWWTGFSLPGAAALILSDRAGMTWSRIYIFLGLVFLLVLVAVLFVPEPSRPKDKDTTHDQSKASGNSPLHWLAATFWGPIREFFSRSRWDVALAILLFIFLFKIGEAFLGRMSIVFYKEIGFTNSEIGFYSKLVGWWVIILFSLVASWLNSRFGLVRGLLVSGIAMAATNLAFAALAFVGPEKWLFATAVIIDNFTTSFSTVTFVSFLSHLTNRAFTASQYALMASLGNLGRTSLASFSGALVDLLGGNWALFFVLTSLMVIPSLLLLLWVQRHLPAQFSETTAGSGS